MPEEKSIYQIRLEKLQRMRELGHDPYAVERFDKTASAKELLDRFDELTTEDVRFAGRVVSFRPMGKAGFMHLSDGEARIQCYFKKDIVGETAWELYNLLDIGDHVGVVGRLFTTKTGEKSIEVHEVAPLSKALHSLPIGKEKEGQSWYGLTDPELRYRHRHLDLIANPSARKMLVDRMKIISAVRRFFDSQGFLEAETPILQVVAGGAAARPFTTHFNAYDMDVKLRISLELYLKRLICGDLPKVYEVGRVFRNEGVSNRHNPEFTLLEFYAAYADMHDMMMYVEELFRKVALEVFGTTVVNAGGVEIDFGDRWRMVDLLSEIERLSGIKKDELQDLESAKKAMERVGLPTEKEHNLGGIIEKLLERFVEPTLIQPTFVVNYPIETSPLAKKDPQNPGLTRRFEGYIRGREVCNAFSEINDPVDQRERFEQQLKERALGDDEAHPMDEEFLYALESGMPPTGGCGIGMDRMAMVLTGAEHIRESLLFPTKKPVSFTVPDLEIESPTENK
ncbi:MAG: lysyl-tRNA synthetase, class [Fimbriimonadaceae bacterium]|nr:lysyl-tRNA synthetase, class [Fimbriimonadaceae bacterium]